MTCWKRFSSLCVVAALFTTIFLRASGVDAATIASCGKWHIVQHPDPSSIIAQLQGTVAISPQDVWAVGYYNASISPVDTLIDHWDGSKWSIIKSPNPNIDENLLQAVAASSSNDVWAVGSTNFGSTTVSKTLIEHWNGSTWSVVASPNSGTGNNFLQSVTVISSTDAWASGYYTNKSSLVEHMLMEHWDGFSWQVVTVPSPGQLYNELEGLTAISANDVWAVGSYDKTETSPLLTLSEHWDGTQWSIVNSVTKANTDANLVSVSAIAANDIWAVGLNSKLGGSGDAKTLTEHWNGTTWSIVSSPNRQPSDALLSVAAVATNNVWAVGNVSINNGGGSHTVIEHWDGTQWSLVSSPNTPNNFNELYGVTVASNGEAWAVGEDNNFSGIPYNTLIVSYC